MPAVLHCTRWAAEGSCHADACSTSMQAANGSAELSDITVVNPYGVGATLWDSTNLLYNPTQSWCVKRFGSKTDMPAAHSIGRSTQYTPMLHSWLARAHAQRHEYGMLALACVVSSSHVWSCGFHPCRWVGDLEIQCFPSSASSLRVVKWMNYQVTQGRLCSCCQHAFDYELLQPAVRALCCAHVATW